MGCASTSETTEEGVSPGLVELPDSLQELGFRYDPSPFPVDDRRLADTNSCSYVLDLQSQIQPHPPQYLPKRAWPLGVVPVSTDD